MIDIFKTSLEKIKIKNDKNQLIDGYRYDINIVATLLDDFIMSEFRQELLIQIVNKLLDKEFATIKDKLLEDKDFAKKVLAETRLQIAKRILEK